MQLVVVVEDIRQELIQPVWWDNWGFSVAERADVHLWCTSEYEETVLRIKETNRLDVL